MKVLVTGAGGYVGSVLCEKLLQENFEVKALDNFSRGNCDTLIRLCEHPNFQFVEADVANWSELFPALKNVDAIVHLAAIVGFPACDKQKELARIVNVEGTRNVAQFVGPIVFASTGSVYGAVEGICKEDSPLNTLTLYGQTKKEGEEILLGAGNSVIYRFATAYGVSPNMRVNLLINDLVYQALKNKCLMVFEPEARRTFINVRDMANAIIFALKNHANMKNEIFNVGSPEGNWTKRQVTDYIRNKTSCYVHYSTHDCDPDKRDYEVDYNKILNMGWKPVYDVGEGIDELIKACRLIKIKHNYE